MVTIAVMTGIASAAVARQRWPVIGCADLSYSIENLYAWKYAPAGYCETGGPLGTLTGITGAHWKQWGQRRAHARGMLVDGLGFYYPAKITAYDRSVTHNFLGMGTYAAWYNKLHVVAGSGDRGGAMRGPFNVFLNVTPQE